MSGIYYSSVQVPVICWPLGEAESMHRSSSQPCPHSQHFQQKHQLKFDFHSQQRGIKQPLSSAYIVFPKSIWTHEPLLKMYKWICISLYNTILKQRAFNVHKYITNTCLLGFWSIWSSRYTTFQMFGICNFF